MAPYGSGGPREVEEATLREGGGTAQSRVAPIMRPLPPAFLSAIGQRGAAG
jgi:hypothetical protein